MDYHLTIGKEINSDTIEIVYSNVFRKNNEYCGFTILSFNEKIGSKLLRKSMLKLKRGLSERCKNEFNEELDYYWLTRFDQQKTTKFHRDNAPTDSYLILGYEPTKIESKILFADYHRFITENNIPIEKYYKLYNPIFKDGEEQLTPYIKEVKYFDKNAYKIVVINNSDLNSDKTLGVLHKAEMITEDLNQVRIVNSIMLYLKPIDEPNTMSKEDETKFVETNEINK